jgi:Integrase core domain
MPAAKISKQAKGELLDVLRQRYRQAAKQDKGKILDEFVALAGCHRKHAIRLLTADPAAAAEAPVAARRTYDEAVRQALIVLWEAADRICGKRLKAVLPGLVAALEQHGHLRLDATVRQRILAVSAATIDRLLASVRGSASRRKKRRAKTRSSKEIPIRTFADYGDAVPGYLEIDFVSHGGTSMQGVFLWSLVATDVCSGWTEAVPLVAREQCLVVEGLEVLRRQFPIPIKGIDSDNDSAFINETLLGYCQQQKLEFTRSRAYQKNDQAWIEQKNGAVVRRFVGYERHSGMLAGQCLARLYQSVRLFVNYFQPSMKLRSKTRVGAKVKKSYHKPATPCERLLAHASVGEAVKQALRSESGRLDPLDLLHRSRESQAALAALSSGELGSGEERESLAKFLAGLADLWRQGEARPTHRKKAPQPRTWRTRKDPFAGVWPDILLWLQEEPDATAKSLFERLEKKHPGRFPEGQLRTLQRRIQDWRRVMARDLVHGCQDGEKPAGTPVVVGARSKD